MRQASVRLVSQPKREKIFGVRARPLDREGKVRIMALARALMRRTEKGKHYGRVTAKGVAVLEALLWGFHNAKSGICFPSLDRIAEYAGCARSTVERAIAMLEETGLMIWINRVVRRKEHGPAGWRIRVMRTSNCYLFNDPLAGTARGDSYHLVHSNAVAPRNRIYSKTEIQSGTSIQVHSFSKERAQTELFPNLEKAIARLGALVKRAP